MKSSLPVITCENCGACCSTQGTPPFSWTGDDRPPPDLVWDVKRHGGRYDASLPCLWFDEKTKLCLHYEARPEACRSEVNPGDEVCLNFRKGML